MGLTWDVVVNGWHTRITAPTITQILKQALIEYRSTTTETVVVVDMREVLEEKAYFNA
jgi:hypothetical protein